MRTAIFLALLLGCDHPPTNSSPLVGRWGIQVVSVGGSTNYQEIFEFVAGGPFNVYYNGMQTCSGSLSYTQGSWWSTATMIMFGAGAICSGAGVQCSGVTA